MDYPTVDRYRKGGEAGMKRRVSINKEGRWPNLKCPAGQCRCSFFSVHHSEAGLRAHLGLVLGILAVNRPC
jgi:hypothetical protein